MPYLDGRKVDPAEIDPAKHAFIGMWRDPWPIAKLTRFEGDVFYHHCSCGEHLLWFSMARDHWQLGHFDEPQYRTLEKP